MSFSPLSSSQVLAILPANTWTEIILHSNTPNKNGIYIATTEKNQNTYSNDKKLISLQSSSFKKVEHFQILKIVAVEINGEWFRGRLISYNEFQSDDTRIELIDVGSFYQTKLDKTYDLPYYFLYDPLILPIKFKNFIPSTSKITVLPLLSESLLYEGIVLVDVNHNNHEDKTQNKKPPLDNKIESNLSDDLNISNNQNLTNGLSITSNQHLTNGLSITSDHNLTNGHDNDVSSEYLSKSLRRGSFYNQTKLYDVPLKNKDYCIITFFENFNSIYVAKATKSDINQYTCCELNIMDSTVNSIDKIPKLNPIVGDIVIALSPEYQVFYRGKILRNNNNESYIVYYIDYGNKETIPSNAIFELADELKKPPIAVKVGTDDLKHLQDTEEIKSLFNDFASKEILFIIEFDETSKRCFENVKLKAVESRLYIDSYVKKCLLSNSRSKVIEQSNENEQTNENSKLINNHDLNKLKNKDKVFIKHFEDMAHVYIVKDTKLFNELMITILKDESAIKSNFKVGDLVKVVSPSFDYRARIKKIEDHVITVLSIDFGFSDEVETNYIYELSDELLKVPGLAITVEIKRPIIKRSLSLDEFIDKIENVPLYLEFDERNSNGYQDITLKRQDNLENIFEEFLNTLACNGISNDSDNNSIIHTEKESLIADFQTIKLENGDCCIVSYFEDFKNIHLCKAVKDCKNSSSYESHNLPIVLETMSSNDRKIKTNLALGDIVKAFSPSYEELYRAKVLNIENNGDIYVLFIDFGNTERIPSNYIYELSETLNIKNELPVSVSIEVPPNAKINDDINNLFKNLINSCEILSIEYNETSINSMENVLLKELKSGCYINDKVLKLLPVEEISIKNQESCFLTHFENFDHLYVAKTLEKEFLKTIMDSTDRKNKTNPAVGDIVKVFSPFHQEMYRALIEGVKGNFYQVFYMDFGNLEQVQSRDIFELSDDLKKEAGLAIEIGINMPSNVKVTKEVSEYFEELASKAELLSIEYDESSEVGLKKCILKVISSGLNINNEVLKRFANQSPVSLEKVENLKMKIEEPIKLPEAVNNKIKSHPLKNGEIVRLRYFHNSTSVFVSRGSEEHLFQHDFVVEKTASDTSKQKKIDIEIGDMVKVMFENIMFRAKILKKEGEGSYLISFIDYGNEVIVFDDEIYELADDLKKIPNLIIEIGIKGSPKIEKTATVTNYLESLELEPLCIEFDEENPNGLREAVLKRKNNSNIFDELIVKPSDIKEEPVQKLRNETVLINAPEPELITNIELKNGDIVFCTYFENFNHLYLCKSTKNTMPEISNFIIDASKVKDITVKKNPKFGEILKVKYEEKIFRAKVLSKSGKMYTVFLIDIGKNINVSADELFEISNDLKNVPRLSQKVGLKETKDLKKTKTVIDYFYNLWHKEPVPLILTYDEDNFNCFNEVNLKKLFNGCDIITDLLKICNTSSNDSINQLKPIAQNSKSNGVQWRIPSGEHVEFLYGNNVENIHVRPIKLYEEYKHILNEFKDGKNAHFKITTPKVNDNVVVYSLKYNGFYRAKIIGPCSDDTSKFRCSFSDYSYIDSILLQHIFELPMSESINTVPLLSQRVSLAGLTRTNSSNNRVISYLGQLTGNSLILEYDKKADRWFKQVVLKDLKNNTCINDEIQKLCQPMSQQRRLERKIIVMSEQKESEIEKPVHPIKSGSSVLVTHFENFNSIFIRDASYEFIESFNAFNKQIMKYYRFARTNEKSEILLNIGDKVCVMSELNPIIYCRAQIIDKINNEYKVFYVDYGNEELVSAEDILELSKELDKPQHFVIKVQIQNIPPLTTENENKLVKEYFKKKIITTNIPLTIEFNELNPKGLDDVVLKTEYYDNNILDEIKSILAVPQLNINLPGQSQNIGQRNSSQTILPYPARRSASMLKQVKQ